VRTAAATLRVVPRAVVRLPRLLSPSAHWRRRLIAIVVLAAALSAGYFFWLRDSSLVRVEHVRVSGLDTPDAARVRAKLAVAARKMTTLNLNPAALRRAVADEPVVHSLTVQADFPHGLTIQIVENRPVAMLVAGGRELAVAPDGTVLPGAKVARALPAVRVGRLPERGQMLDGPALERVAVAAAAPPRLLARVDSISIQDGRGAVAELQDGPPIYFGRPIELERKWVAAAGVLAQQSSRGATYIDVRMPERPVAGGLGIEQQPQGEAQAPPPGSAAGAPSVIYASPGQAAGTPAQPQQTAGVTPQTQAQTTGTASQSGLSSGAAPAQPTATNPQP
jgi:cell division protein FtsQ